MGSFAEPRDSLAPPRRIPIAIRVLIGFSVVTPTALLLVVVFSNPSSARIADLCGEDAKTVQEIRAHGILVFAGEIKPTFKPHVIVDVHWESASKQYYVTGASLRSTKYSNLSHLIRRFSRLRRLELPHATAEEAQRIARRYPELEVVR